MADTPGKLISSLSNTEGRPPKVGGYAGAFLHLFDWNRRLSGKHSKSLPSGERKNGNVKEDKLSMAKLLLIADENRGGYPKEELCQSDFGSDKSTESGSTKKPSVVARLMGLESLPDTTTENVQYYNKDVNKNEQQQQPTTKIHHIQQLQMLEGLFQDDQQGWKVNKDRKQQEEKLMPKNTKISDHHMEKFVPVSPKKKTSSLASMLLSPSKNKGQGISHRRRALLMGAATKILEPASTSRAKLLLDNKPSSEPATGDRGRKTNNAPKDKDNKKPNVVKRNGPASVPLLKEKNDNVNSKDTATKMRAKVDQGLEQDDETQSCESQTSSSKENHGTVTECQVKGPVSLRRSGSVKEEQPPTPPSRGSLFRSKSVREEQVAGVTPDAKRTTSKAAKDKEVRLKRDSKRQRSPSQENVSEEQRMRRKPALDQGRKQQDIQPKEYPVTTKTIKRGGVQEVRDPSKNSSSIGRLFGSRKHSKRSLMDQQPDTTSGIDEAGRRFPDEETLTKQPKEEVSKKATSLMKSFLGRGKSSKTAEPVWANKKMAPTPKAISRSNYERQIRSAGSSPARTFNEPNAKEVADGDVVHLEGLEDDSYASDTEVVMERNHVTQDKSRLNIPASKQPQHTSMEDIFKNYYTNCPLPKEFISTELMELVQENGGEDSTVVDMDISPVENDTTGSSPYDDIVDLPNKVLFEEEDDNKQVTTPCSPGKKNLGDTGFSLDTSDSLKENTGPPGDGGQPSPVSVLDFSALQSSFPSEATTSSEDNDEDDKQTLLSDADSAPVAVNAGSCQEALLEILDSYDTRLSESSELNEYAGSDAIELYVREVLVGAGLVTDDYYVDSVPSTQEISEMLQVQQQARGLESEMKLCSIPGAQKLMDGCIEEALNSVLAPFRHDKVDVSLQGWMERPCGEELVGMVTGYILAWQDMTPEAMDTLLDLDMNMSSKQWSQFRDEIFEVAVELERLIFRSLMEDLIADLVSLH